MSTINEPKPAFRGGPNIAMKIPVAEFEATLRFEFSNRNFACSHKLRLLGGEGVRFSIIFAAAVIAIVLCGCSGVEDWTFGSGRCEVHNITMDTLVVHNCSALCILFSDDYTSARERKFPHAGPDYGREFFGKKRGKIYVCPRCVEARSAWKVKD